MAYIPTLRSPLRRYGRPMMGFGDMPITSPTQVDPSLPATPPPCSQAQVGQQCTPDGDLTVATVGPTIVPPTTSLTDWLKNAWASLSSGTPAPITTTVTGTGVPTSTPVATSVPSSPNWLLWGGAAVAAYMLFGKKKKV